MNSPGQRRFNQASGGFRRSLALLFVVLSGGLVSGELAYGQSNAKVITWGPAASNSNYVGILGEIHKPGVYQLDPKSLNIQSVLRRAGGMTDDASGTIRVVRQDRIVESLYFSPQTNPSLLAGDLLMVESKRAQAAISRLYDADPQVQAEYAKAAALAVRGNDPGGIQVAFVNVIDRPVVVKIKHENARLAQVVHMLDQPIELANSVRIIGPDRMINQATAPQSIQTPLANGSVLVFPKHAINRNKLPPFPVPYESEIASGAFPSLIGAPSGQSPELRNVGKLPPLIAQGETQGSQPPANLEQATIPLPAATIEQPTPSSERLEIPAPAAPSPAPGTPSRIATIPFSGQPRIKSSSQLLKEPDSDPAAPAEPQKAINAKNLKASKPSSIDPDDLLDELEPPQASNSTSLTVIQMLGITMCVGMLIGLALLARRHFERQQILDAAPNLAGPSNEASAETEYFLEPSEEAATTESTAPTATITWFDQLLRNELPLREEQADFPSQLALQGRIVPPPVFRVDPAMIKPPGDGPHFAISGPADVQTSLFIPKPMDESEHVIDEFDAAHSSRPSKPHFMKRRPGENTIAAAAAASSKQTPRSEVEMKPSDTPVTDALRQLQGGQQ